MSATAPAKPLFIPSSRQVRAIRGWLGLKQPDMAKRCSVSLSALADYELGRRRTSQDTLNAIGAFVSTLDTITITVTGEIGLRP